MGRRSSSSDAKQSSIILLQERFKKLHRAKEMREAKQLLKLFSASAQVTRSSLHEPCKTFLRSELILPPTPEKSSVDVVRTDSKMHADAQVIETPSSGNCLSTDRVMHKANKFEDSDIDTSLHL
ncbi:hypothetical protein RJ641_000512 [Dillenia turbinata]|uniref:Uncharacterized protein n=1 Tax=Dillenia turbinata TaxID=194707 RepID=A0AAN8ZMF0_9MAGN